jgi:hypothetical protein
MTQPTPPSLKDRLSKLYLQARMVNELARNDVIIVAPAAEGEARDNATYWLEQMQQSIADIETLMATGEKP